MPKTSRCPAGSISTKFSKRGRHSPEPGQAHADDGIAEALLELLAEAGRAPVEAGRAAALESIAAEESLSYFFVLRVPEADDVDAVRTLRSAAWSPCAAISGNSPLAPPATHRWSMR